LLGDFDYAPDIAGKPGRGRGDTAGRIGRNLQTTTQSGAPSTRGSGRKATLPVTREGFPDLCPDERLKTETASRRFPQFQYVMRMKSVCMKNFSRLCVHRIKSFDLAPPGAIWYQSGRIHSRVTSVLISLPPEQFGIESLEEPK
jgi:hypothetical protein